MQKIVFFFLYDQFFAKKMWNVRRRFNVNVQTLRAPIIYCSRCISISNIIENPIMHLANGYTYINHACSEKVCFFSLFYGIYMLVTELANIGIDWKRARLRTSGARAKDEPLNRLFILGHPNIDSTALRCIIIEAWSSEISMRINFSLDLFFRKSCAWAVRTVLDIIQSVLLQVLLISFQCSENFTKAYSQINFVLHYLCKFVSISFLI